LPQSRNGPKIMLRGAEADVLAAPVPSLRFSLFA